MSRCEITPEQAGGQNVCAFLDMLAWSEGTDKPGQPTKDRGYDVLVGGRNFTDYKNHPRILVDLPRLRIKSTAAGRYQLLGRYYDWYKETLRLPDFSPLSQDKIAIQQIKERKAYALIQQGDFNGAVERCKNIWASLPGAGYNQHERKLDNLVLAYERAGGSFA